MAPRTSDPARDRVEDRVGALAGVAARLSSSGDLGELFARAAELARRDYGFDRVVVLSVQGEALTAEVTDPLEHGPSDLLRRAMLDRPLALRPDTPLTVALAGGAGGPTSAEGLAELLDLREHTLLPVAVDGRALAVLIADRAECDVQPLDLALLETFAAFLGVAAERLILRARLREVAAEIRQLSASARALVGEALDAPITMPVRGRGHSWFPAVDTAPVAYDVRDHLTPRERTIAELMARGKSNREIAEHLVLAPETIKANAARMFRKLGAPNRVAAVTAYLHLTGQLHGPVPPSTRHVDRVGAIAASTASRGS